MGQRGGGDGKKNAGQEADNADIASIRMALLLSFK